MRIATVAVVALAAFAALGARCIERTHTYVDKDGYTHITGEMDNDTNIQGAAIVLRGTLLDDANNVVATKDAPTCPPDTQPQNQTVFDIRFDNPNIPPWTHFTVNAVSGRALESPLPPADVVLFSSEAVRFDGVPPIPGLGITDDDVFLTFSARNRSQTPLTMQACVAVYNQAGEVTYVTSDELVQRSASGGIEPAVIVDTGAPGSAFFVAKDVPKGPVQIRAWLWFGAKGAPTSNYQFVTTGLITIQTIKVN
jgi:hypothetical protein